MKRILIVITTAFVPYGGLTTVMMNYYRAMGKKKLKIDFASTNEPPEVLLKELNENGSQYFNLGDRKKHLIKYLKKLNKVLRGNSYDVIHVNGNSATMAFELRTAKRRRVPVRIAHGHTTRSDYSWLHKILFRVFRKSYTHAIAVSDKAGEWLFSGQEYIVLNNAIPVKKYKYDMSIREKYRNSLGFSDKFIVGNVGKLYAAKNHSFLIQIFCELRKKKENAHLLIVGGGELRGELEEQCRSLGIEDDVTFLGMREDIPELLQTMDIFVFPSRYEGFGMALIEAQAAGLYCFASESVPGETKLSNNIQYISLNEKVQDWVEKISVVNCYNRMKCSIQACSTICACGYDIETAVEKLEKIYNGIG